MIDFPDLPGAKPVKRPVAGVLYGLSASSVQNT